MDTACDTTTGAFRTLGFEGIVSTGQGSGATIRCE